MQEKYGLYCVARLLPSLREDPDDEFFTRAEKEHQIREFYRRRLKIPLCLDHCDADVWNFVVPERDRIGYVLDLFIGRDDALMVKFRLSNRHPAYAKIYNGIHERHERWGVSVWIERLQQLGQPTVVSKKLTHVALTLRPRFGAYGTYMHPQYALNERTIDRIIARELYQPGAGSCFACKEFQKKLSDATGVRMEEQQQQTTAIVDERPMATETVESGSSAPLQAQPDSDSNKRVRLESETTGSGFVQSLAERQIDTTVDISKLSVGQIREQMDEVLAHAAAAQRTVDKLPMKEQAHYFKLATALNDRTETAEKYCAELKGSGVYNTDDIDLWIDMLRKNDINPLAKDMVASFAAASEKYGEKKMEGVKGERDAAVKRAQDAESQLEVMKKRVEQPLAGGKPTVSGLQQQQQQQKQQQQQPVYPQKVELKAVHTYYNKFGDNEFVPFGQSHSTVTKNSFTDALQDAIMRRCAQPVTTVQTGAVGGQ